MSLYQPNCERSPLPLAVAPEPLLEPAAPGWPFSFAAFPVVAALLRVSAGFREAILVTDFVDTASFGFGEVLTCGFGVGEVFGFGFGVASGFGFGVIGLGVAALGV